jgi:hypothetical protein
MPVKPYDYPTASQRQILRMHQPDKSVLTNIGDKVANTALHLTATGLGTAFGAETAMNMAIDQVGQGFIADQLVGPMAGVAGGVVGSAIGSTIDRSLPTFDTTVDTVIAAT